MLNILAIFFLLTISMNSGAAALEAKKCPVTDGKAMDEITLKLKLAGNRMMNSSPPHSANAVAFSYSLHKFIRDNSEQSISFFMTMDIVNLFKVIQINKCEGEGTVLCDRISSVVSFSSNPRRFKSPVSVSEFAASTSALNARLRESIINVMRQKITKTIIIFQTAISELSYTALVVKSTLTQTIVAKSDINNPVSLLVYIVVKIIGSR